MAYAYDPAGVLWHVCERREGGDTGLGSRCLNTRYNAKHIFGLSTRISMTTPLRFDDSQREGTDIALYKRLTRDVCFLFHELADYGHIMGDLNYAEDYPLPYWELLNRVDTGRPDDRLIRSGILILLMAMLRDQFDGSGSWISKYLDQVTSALTLFVPEDDDMLRLCDSVSHGVSLLRNNCGPDEPFEAASVWAYDAVVRRYFLNAAQMR